MGKKSLCHKAILCPDLIYSNEPIHSCMVWRQNSWRSACHSMLPPSSHLSLLHLQSWGERQGNTVAFISLETAKNVNSQASTQTYWIRNSRGGGPAGCFIKPSKWSQCMLKSKSTFEKKIDAQVFFFKVLRSISHVQPGLGSTLSTPVFPKLGIKSRASHMPGKHPTTELHPQP
jgi:hypothetical protein